MLKKIFICDGCEKEIDYSNKAKMDYSQGIIYLKPENNSKYSVHLKFYLCEDCFDRVIKYISGLRQAPGLSVSEIKRCGECEDYEACDNYCKYGSQMTCSDWFCRYGRKREEDE